MVRIEAKQCACAVVCKFLANGAYDEKHEDTDGRAQKHQEKDTSIRVDDVVRWRARCTIDPAHRETQPKPYTATRSRCHDNVRVHSRRRPRLFDRINQTEEETDEEADVGRAGVLKDEGVKSVGNIKVRRNEEKHIDDADD